MSNHKTNLEYLKAVDPLPDALLRFVRKRNLPPLVEAELDLALAKSCRQIRASRDSMIDLLLNSANTDVRN